METAELPIVHYECEIYDKSEPLGLDILATVNGTAEIDGARLPVMKATYRMNGEASITVKLPAGHVDPAAVANAISTATTAFLNRVASEAPTESNGGAEQRLLAHLPPEAVEAIKEYALSRYLEANVIREECRQRSHGGAGGDMQKRAGVMESEAGELLEACGLSTQEAAHYLKTEAQARAESRGGHHAK